MDRPQKWGLLVLARSCLAPVTLTLLSSMVPRAGVTSFMDTTCSSTGGMPAPVPCADTCRGQHGRGMENQSDHGKSSMLLRGCSAASAPGH